MSNYVIGLDFGGSSKIVYSVKKYNEAPTSNPLENLPFKSSKDGRSSMNLKSILSMSDLLPNKLKLLNEYFYEFFNIFNRSEEPTAESIKYKKASECLDIKKYDSKCCLYYNNDFIGTDIINGIFMDFLLDPRIKEDIGKDDLKVIKDEYIGKARKNYGFGYAYNVSSEPSENILKFIEKCFESITPEKIKNDFSKITNIRNKYNSNYNRFLMNFDYVDELKSNFSSKFEVEVDVSSSGDIFSKYYLGNSGNNKQLSCLFLINNSQNEEMFSHALEFYEDNNKEDVWFTGKALLNLLTKINKNWKKKKKIKRIRNWLK